MPESMTAELDGLGVIDGHAGRFEVVFLN